MPILQELSLPQFDSRLHRCGLAGAFHSEGDPVHCEREQATERFGLLAFLGVSPFVQKTDLQKVQWVDMGIPAVQGFGQNGLTRQQTGMTRDGQDRIHGSSVAQLNHAKDLVANFGITDQGGIVLRNAKVCLGEGNFGVVDQLLEERPFFVHLNKLLQTVGIL